MDAANTAVTAHPNQWQHAIGVVFDEAQRNASAHRKLANALYKLLIDAAHQQATAVFHTAMFNLLVRILSIKKSEPAANRLNKFIDGFLSMMASKEGFSRYSIL